MIDSNHRITGKMGIRKQVYSTWLLLRYEEEPMVLQFPDAGLDRPGNEEVFPTGDNESEHQDCTGIRPSTSLDAM